MRDTDPAARLATLPIDERARFALAGQGLRHDLVDTADEAAFDDWVRANRRGFHDTAPDAESLPRRRAAYAGRRLSGVWDDAAALSPTTAGIPIATIGSWRTALTVPGGTDVDLCAISSVTVAPSHAGRRIARTLLEGELRAAAGAGFALAGLTVTDSGLYARYGFGPAAFAAKLDIDPARARWRGGEPAGDVVMAELADVAPLLARVHERAKRRSPGDVAVSEGQWAAITGADAPDEAASRAHRFACHRDADGEIDGVVVYRLEKHPQDFTVHDLVVEHLVAATDDAERGLWRFVLRVPLVRAVRAPLRPVDDPLPWLVGDARAVQATRVDHHWLRILDVVGALEARAYEAEGSLELWVRDGLWYADGRYLLQTDARGRGRVTRLETPIDAGHGARAPEPVGASVIEVDVADLASMLLGGVGASELARAGRITGQTEAVALADRMLRTARAPWLSTWY